MRGKTKSFFEDTSIIIIAIAAIYGIYYIYANYFFEVENTKTDSIVTIEKPKIKHTVKIEKNIKIEPILNIKKEIIKENIKIVEKNIIIEKEPIIKEIILPIKIKEKKKEIEKVEKKVDLKLLRAFLIETQYKIRKNIIYPVNINNDINETKQNRTLKFKITILKDGTYEQLTYVSGDKDILKKNRENILKVFPLVIDDKIVGDFPRYLRIKIK